MSASPVPVIADALPPGAGGRPHERTHRLLLLTLALLALLAPLAAVPAAHATPPAVEVLDEAGVLDDPQALEDRISGVSFREEVQLEVLTLDSATQDVDTSDERVLNDAVLAYARAEHPEWIDGDTWADGVVIVALDPVQRKLGTYAGDDVKLSDGGFEDVQDAMRDDAADSAWEDALEAGAQEYADLLGRPWWQSPGAILVAVVAFVIVAIGAITALWRGAGVRHRVAEARARHEDVRARRRETEDAATRIPRDSAYGAAVLADVEDHRRSADEAERLVQQLPERPGPLWGISPTTSRLGKEYEEAVGTADDADDTIINAAHLLGRSGDHRAAWQEERRPLDESLAAVEETIRDSEVEEKGPSAAADALRATAREVAPELEQVSRDYLEGSRSPDECLERLDELTGRLATASSRLREEVIGARAEDRDEIELMRQAEPEKGFVSEFPSSVRGRRQARHPGAYATDYSLSPVLWTGAWYGGATSALDTHRHPPASTSGSTSGYSGGGFSGAGSSSSF